MHCMQTFLRQGEGDMVKETDLTTETEPQHHEDHQTPQREPPKQMVLMASAELTVMESENQAVVEVVRMGALTSIATVNYETVNGSAKSGQDFQPVAGTLTFDPAEFRKVIVVPLISDSNWEASETFEVSQSTTQDIA